MATRTLFALPAVALIGAGLAACGGAGRGQGAASSATSNAAAIGMTTIQPPRAQSSTLSPEHVTGRYLNDGDKDHIGDPDTDNSSDDDEDPYYDYKPDDNGRYHDSDDPRILAYGHAAGPADERAIATVVRRYYALAAAGDARGACSTFPPNMVKEMPEAYGRLGPPYLRGARSCREVMERVFKAVHGELRFPVAVTGVGVEGDRAQVLLGSRSMPASYVTLWREGGVWRISGLIGGPLP